MDELMLTKQYILKNTSCFAMHKNGEPKMGNLLNSASNQPSKFRTRNWVEINDNSRGTECRY